MKYDERENVESAIASAKKTAMAWNKKSFNADLQFIANGKPYYLKYLLNDFFVIQAVSELL